MLKKVLVILMALIVLTGMTACGSGQTDHAGDPSDSESAGISVVTTIFPVYDWTRSVAGADNDGVDISMLIDSGVDLHSFQPTAEDIMKISECDVFIYVGGESDEWVEDALGEAVNGDMKVVNLMDVMGSKAKEEEVKEGMQAEDEHEHDGDEEGHDENAEHEDEEEGPEYDEHVWLSLSNAKILSSAIADALAEADPENANTYKANAVAYAEKLGALDAEYKETVDAASVKTLLFGDRFPFRYMTDDYGLDYYAAFVGCSAETEASFETIAFLSDKVDELGLQNIMTIEGTDHSIAESIRNNTQTKDQQILTMDSMQGTTAQDVDAGATYLSVMEKNLETLREALK